MSLRVLFKLLLTSTVFFSCSKEVNESYVNQAVFTLYGDINGRYVQFSGGIDNYYMNTEIESSFEYDNRELRIMTGKIENIIEPNNGEKLSIRIRNTQFGGAFWSNLDSLFAIKNLNYFTPTSNSYLVNFNPAISFPGDEFIWNFGDETTVTTSNPNISHRYVNPNQDRFNVCLRVRDGAGCDDEICYDLVMPFASCDASLITNPSGNPGPTNDYFYSVNASGAEPLTYNWEFRSGLNANTSSVKYAYDQNQQLIEHVRVQVTDAIGCTTRLERKLNIGNLPDSCYVNFTHSTPRLDSTDFPGFGNVEVIYTDDQGVDFSTAGLTQPSTSNFEIISYSPYINDRFGNNTVSLEVMFNCTLHDDNGNEIILSNFNGQIAIPY